MVNTHIGPNTEVEQFLGIPYALPPVGDRRFEYPKPPVAYPNGELIIYLIIIYLKVKQQRQQQRVSPFALPLPQVFLTPAQMLSYVYTYSSTTVKNQ